MVEKSPYQLIRDRLASPSPAMQAVFEDLRRYAASAEAAALRSLFRRDLDIEPRIKFDPDAMPWRLRQDDPDRAYLEPIEPAPAKRPTLGRRPSDDGQLVAEGVAMLRGGGCRTAHAAAGQLADRAKGASRESTVARLHRKIRKCCSSKASR